MSESPTTAIAPVDDAVLRVGRDVAVVTAIERFDLDGGEVPGGDPADRDRMVALARTHAPDSVGTPGLRAVNFHRSLDGRRVVNLGLWTGFEEFAALLTRPGFTGGAEYWTGVAGVRPHYFDVAAVVSR